MWTQLYRLLSKWWVLLERKIHNGWYNNLHVLSTSTRLHMCTVLLIVEENNVPCEPYLVHVSHWDCQVLVVFSEEKKLCPKDEHREKT
jgi:hypothetical protein